MKSKDKLDAEKYIVKNPMPNHMGKCDFIKFKGESQTAKFNIWFPVSRISKSLPGKKFGRDKFISWLYFLFFEIICNEPTNSIYDLKTTLYCPEGDNSFFLVQQLQFEAGIVLPWVLRGKIEV